MPGWNAGPSSGNPLTTGQPNQASYKVHEVQERVNQVKGIMCVHKSDLTQRFTC